MEFKNRNSTHPGRIQLKKVSDGSIETYDVIMADGATEQGTPLNEATLNELKKDLLNAVLQFVNASNTQVGIGIDEITACGQNTNGNVYRIHLNNGAYFDFTAPRGAKGDKGSGVSGEGFYTTTESLSTGVGRYDVSSVTYKKPELEPGDLVLSVKTGDLVRVRSLTSDGFMFIGEWVYKF